MTQSAARWAGFVAMCAGMFMAVLDIQIVVTSLPAISAALAIPPERMSWVQTAYLIAEVIAIPLTGYLTRCFGLRGLFLAALSLFLAASLACAAASGFGTLIAARIVQGFAGGFLIPIVFSAVFLLFPSREQAAATAVAGALAVLAPTLGPTVGGYITETWSWPWLFLVNIGPGILALAVAAVCLPRERPVFDLLRRIDWVGLGLLAAALGCLLVALKEGPERGWATGPVLALLATTGLASAGFVVRGLVAANPLVRLRLFADRNFALACALSFLFGAGLYSAVYLMPAFLGLVRGHGSLDIGLTMLVTGATQLAVAPLAVWLERRIGARLLTGLGFLAFAVGLAMSGFQTRETDFDEMFWPQVVRGAAIMFCLLPPTRIALGYLAPDAVADGSGLFNLMRNLGGAIGIALVDTVMWQRSPIHAGSLADRVLAGDEAAARAVGIPPAMVPRDGRLPSEDEIAFVRPMFETAGLVEAINEAWLLLAVLTVAGLLLLPAIRRMRRPGGGDTTARKGDA